MEHGSLTRVTRRSLLLVEAESLQWREEALREPPSNEVRVRTLYGAISVGTEAPLYRGTSRGSEPSSYPKMTGYESYGVVEACGEEVRGLSVGDRVVGFYGHRTFEVAPAHRFIRVPSGLEPPLALLAILSCDVKKGILKVAPEPDEPVLVTGGGAIGLLTLFVLRALEVERVDVVEPLPERRNLQPLWTHAGPSLQKISLASSATPSASSARAATLLLPSYRSGCCRRDACAFSPTAIWNP